MDVAQAVGRALAARGVEQVFGVLGSGNLDVTNALHQAGARFVHARHECAAVCMADAYARVTSSVGVATLHQGPGLTNALTGLTEAAKARTPLVVITAATSGAAVHSNFRIDQAGAVHACGASVDRIHGAATVMEDLERTWHTAATQRRTVVLELPLDVQSATVESRSDLGPARPVGRDLHPGTADARAVAELADLVEDSRRPVVIGGRGAVLAGAGKDLQRLADRAGAVLATSANANGLFAGDPWSVGISGGFASPVAAELIASADLLLVFGASLNQWTTRHGRLVGAGTRIAQIDVEPAALGRHRPVDMAIAADAGRTATALDAELHRRGLDRTGFRATGTRTRIAEGGWRDTHYVDASTADTIDPRTLTILLDDLLPTARTVAIDSGHFMGWPAMYLGVPDAAGFVFTQSFQSVGLGLGAAIGAATARPDRLTVAALGDGGAMMALGELETAAHLGAPLLVVVYNDAAYGAEVHHFGPLGRSTDLVRFPPPDLAAYARAAGGTGLTVRTAGDLAELEEWLDDPHGLAVVDAKITPTVVASWLEEAFRAH